MANDYCTADDIKAAMPDTTWGTDYDTLLGKLASYASREFDRLTNREAGTFAADTDSERTFDGSGDAMLWIDDLAAAPTAVEVDEACSGSYSAWDSGQYVCWPYNALSKGMPFVRLDINRVTGSKGYWPGGQQSVKVIGPFGYSVTSPDDVEWAAIRIAMRFFKRAQQAYQDTGAIPELGQLRYTKGTDPEVDQIIRRLRRITT